MSKHTINLGSAHGKRTASIVKRADCTADSFYKSPAGGSTVSLNAGLEIQWDTSCIGQPRAIDIALLSPELSSVIHRWSNVDFSKGQYSAQINPEWYQNKATIKLQLSIVSYGTPAFLQSGPMLPSGPFFTGSFNSSAPINLVVDSLSGNSSGQVTVVNNFYKGLTKGQVAAAVLMPILFVAACITGYVFWSRKKEAQRRKEYRENLDQRMSVAPGADWAPISAAGAAAAIRQSMAFSSNGGDRNTRASSFFGRPSSTYQGDPPQEMRQTRSRTDSTGEQSRVSRVSFADTAVGRTTNRPAVPPLPAAYRKSAFDADISRSPDNDTLSPTQREGAYPLDEDSIRDRLSGASANNGRNSVEGGFGHDADTLPALAMMRANETTDGKTPAPPPPALTRESTAGDYRTYSIGAYSGNTDSIMTDNTTPSYFNPPVNSQDPDEALRVYASRNPQMVPVTTTASPFSGFAAGPGLAAAAGFDMSPDAVFRAYAATRPAAPPTAATPSTPGAMRTLYNPTMTQGLGLRPRADTESSTAGDRNPYRDTIVSGNYEDGIGKAQ